MGYLCREKNIGISVFLKMKSKKPSAQHLEHMSCSTVMGVVVAYLPMHGIV